MTSNFFAALDDSGDEEVLVPVKAKVVPSTKQSDRVLKKPDAAKHDRSKNSDARSNKAGRPRPAARDGKRTFDRRSGTGRGKEIKKGGGGARNWGSDKNEARKAEGTIDEVGEVPKTEEPEKTDAVTAVEDPIVEKKEEEIDNTMTLEEYLKAKASPESALFKKKETVNFDNEFVGKTASVSVEKDFLTTKNEKNLRKKGSKKEEKIKMDITFQPKKSNGYDGQNRRDQDGDRRTGRGGNRGGRGGRVGRGFKDSRSETVNVLADPNSFPSLSVS